MNNELVLCLVLKMINQWPDIEFWFEKKSYIRGKSIHPRKLNFPPKFLLILGFRFKKTDLWCSNRFIRLPCLPMLVSQHFRFVCRSYNSYPWWIHGFKTVRARSCTSDIVAGIKFGLINKTIRFQSKLCKQKSPLITLFELQEHRMSQYWVVKINWDKNNNWQ